MINNHRASRSLIRRKGVGLLVGTGAGLAACLPSASLAQSADSLIDKLVEKGVLTVKEANELREETDKDFVKAYSVKSGMSDWVTALKINGDFRGRFEGFYADNPNFIDRSRFRYRLRLGATATMMDDFEVGLRLGSGDIDSAKDMGSGSDPISNNQSLQNNASKKGIFIDQAYAKWTPLNRPTWTGAFTVGKMENPFVLSDMLFDGDYTPEGAAQQFIYRPSPQHAIKLNLGEFVLDEIGSSGRDPYLLGGQLMLDSTFNSSWSSSLGASFLSIQNGANLKSSDVPDINAGNLRVAAAGPVLTQPANNFDTVVGSAALTYTLGEFPVYPGAFPIRLFGEYLHNGAADTGGDGYHVGITFGRAGKKRTWEITYRWKHLEGDAWWEELADSDFGAFYNDALSGTATAGRALKKGYAAGTNVRGHVIKVGYSPLDSLTFTFTWFSTELIEPYKPGSDSHMDRVQLDAAWKF